MLFAKSPLIENRNQALLLFKFVTLEHTYIVSTISTDIILPSKEANIIKSKHKYCTKHKNPLELTVVIGLVLDTFYKAVHLSRTVLPRSIYALHHFQEC